MQGTLPTLQPDNELEDLLFQATTQATTTATEGKSPNQTDGLSYYAVRKGCGGLRSCIFRFWRDCEKYVNGYSEAEYSIFDRIEDALEYTSVRDGDDTRNQHGYVNSSDRETRFNENEALALTEGTTNMGDTAVKPADNVGGMSAVGKDTGSTATMMSVPDTTGIGAPIQSKQTSLSTNLDAENINISFATLPSLSIVAKKSTGTVPGQKALANPNRRPTKVWYRLYEKFKNYKEKHGSMKIDSSKENADLKRWVKQQQTDYRLLKEGKPSGMFQLKIDKLKKLDFKFNYVGAHDRIEALIEYKKQHGNYNIPQSHPVLGKWIQEERSIATTFISGNTNDFFEHKINELKALSAKTDCHGQLTSVYDAEEQKWNEFFEQLVEYKKKHDTCEVAPSLHTPLSYWVVKQHQEYQKVKDGEPSRLTVDKMQKLIDLGFIFREVKTTLSWEERMEQLRKYKQEHGHVKVPKSHPELGVFVNRQRYEYSKWVDGRPSSMTEKRHKDLQELDFVFVAGKKMNQASVKNKKTWDERYSELLHYRQLYGHTVVPQSFPGLGEWVHTQRNYYKKMKEGKKSPLTRDRLLKLADVGFVFDATKRRGAHISEDQNIHLHVSMMEEDE